MKFANESKAYRSARNRLLSAEKALRRKIEAVAALRRKLPAGGERRPGKRLGEVEELLEGVGADHAALVKQALHGRVGAGKRAGV